MRKLIARIDVNTCDYDKRTPLHLAASEGHVDIVKLLLEYDAKIVKDRWGNTPLTEIVDKTGTNYSEIMRLLKHQNEGKI